MDKQLKKIREHFGLSQRDFAKKINIGASTLALFETGDRIPKDIHIKRICDEFNVNESWLRTGEGGDENMFKKDFLEDEYTRYAAEIGNGASDNIKAAIIKYGRLSPENKKIINDALKIMLESFNKD